MIAALYRLLRYRNDAASVSRSLSSASPRPVVMRIARKGLGRTAGRMMGRLR